MELIPQQPLSEIRFRITIVFHKSGTHLKEKPATILFHLSIIPLQNPNTTSRNPSYPIHCLHSLSGPTKQAHMLRTARQTWSPRSAPLGRSSSPQFNQHSFNSSQTTNSIPTTMRLASIFLSLASLACAAELGIETTHKVECTRKTQNGDGVSMHYRGTLQDTGKEFDSSYKRNSPLSFKLGTGRVIKG